MSHRRVCYFDNNATTRVAPEVVEAMLPFLRDQWGNPSSAYRFGHQVAKHVATARERVAALLHAEPREIVFTSCGTESNNTAIHSALAAHPAKRHVITSAVEHSANMNYGKFLKEQGFQVTFIPVDADGLIDIHRVEKAIRPDTAIVSIMWANNETGIIFPIEELAAICRSKGVLFHTDAVQAPGKISLDARGTGVDMLSLSAHKLNAPKGIGCLYVKKHTRFHPYLIGGHQEHGRRGGTENVPYIVGFGVAAEMALSRLHHENTFVRALRDRLETQIFKLIPNVIRNGAKEPRLPNTSNLSFLMVEAEAILTQLDHVGICASSGSACTTGSLEPSHVLTAMGISAARARGSVRFSLGAETTAAEVAFLLEQLPPMIEKLRGASVQSGTAPSKSRSKEPGRLSPRSAAA